MARSDADLGVLGPHTLPTQAAAPPRRSCPLTQVGQVGEVDQAPASVQVDSWTAQTTMAGRRSARAASRATSAKWRPHTLSQPAGVAGRRVAVVGTSDLAPESPAGCPLDQNC